MSGPNSDTVLKDRILAGLAAASALETRFRKPLERFLAGLCRRGDGRSLEKIPEIVGRLLERCYAMQPSLLERWRGGDNLESFLRTVAANDLRTWWKSAEHRKRREPDGEEDIASTVAADAAEAPEAEEEEIALAVEALRFAVGEAVRQVPEGVVLLRLRGLHGIEQRALARCWGHHEAQTSRRIREAMETIRDAATHYARERGFELTREAWQASLQRDRSLLFGRESAAAPVENHETELVRLASGDMSGQAHADDRRRLVALLAGSPGALGRLALHLSGQAAGRPAPGKDPAFEGIGARLLEAARKFPREYTPMELASLADAAARDFLADLLRTLRAEGGTLWLRCPDAPALQAVLNPLEPEIIGRRQPLASGLIGLVFATGEGLLSVDVPEDARHSPLIDASLGRQTRSLMAVPFRVAGEEWGVLTAVRLANPSSFGQDDLHRLQRGSIVLARLMLQTLWISLLEIDPDERTRDD